MRNTKQERVSKAEQAYVQARLAAERAKRGLSLTKAAALIQQSWGQVVYPQDVRRAEGRDRKRNTAPRMDFVVAAAAAYGVPLAAIVPSAGPRPKPTGSLGDAFLRVLDEPTTERGTKTRQRVRAEFAAAVDSYNPAHREHVGHVVSGLVELFYATQSLDESGSAVGRDALLDRAEEWAQYLARIQSLPSPGLAAVAELSAAEWLDFWTLHTIALRRLADPHSRHVAAALSTGLQKVDHEQA